VLAVPLLRVSPRHELAAVKAVGIVTLVILATIVGLPWQAVAKGSY
jgi:hypothetical protein